MKQFKAFASKLRIDILLCCGATVVLSACGGGNIDAGADQLAATAASVSTDARDLAAASTAAPAAAVEASTEAAPAASIQAAPTAIPEASAASTEAAGSASNAGATGQTAEVTTQAFELTGYDSKQPQPQPQTGQQDAGANTPASGPGLTH